MVDDGMFGEHAVGDLVPDVGLRLSSSWLRPAGQDAEPAVELVDISTHLPVYRVSGTCSHVSDAMVASISTATVQVVAQPDHVRLVGGSAHSPVLERYSSQFRTPRLGQHVVAQGHLDVMAGYEFDAYNLPDVRRDWRLNDVRLAYDRAPFSTAPPDGAPAREQREPPRLQRWLNVGVYWVDLDPA